MIPKCGLVVIIDNTIILMERQFKYDDLNGIFVKKNVRKREIMPNRSRKNEEKQEEKLLFSEIVKKPPKYENTEISQRLFVEHISIPRGKKEQNENELECAFREFIEETNTCPTGNIFLEKKRFILQWIDDNVVWRYVVYKIYATNLVKIKNVCHVKFNFSEIIVKRQYEKLSKEPWHKQLSLTIPTYKALMKYQIKLYQASNYCDFLNFIETKNDNFIKLKVILI